MLATGHCRLPLRSDRVVAGSALRQTARTWHTSNSGPPALAAGLANPPALFGDSFPQAVQGAADPTPAVQHVSVNPRGPDVPMTQEFLHRSDVVAVLQQVGCKRKVWGSAGLVSFVRHTAGMSASVKEQEATNPGDIRFLRAAAVAPGSQDLDHAVVQTWRRLTREQTRRSVVHGRLSSGAPDSITDLQERREEHSVEEYSVTARARIGWFPSSDRGSARPAGPSAKCRHGSRPSTR